MNSIETLIEALPYISRFNGKVVVIKYGGAAMLDDKLQKSVMTDIVMLKQCGLRPIVVHGGGKVISENLNHFDIETKFVNGLRYTDEQTMNIVQMTLSGDIAKNLVKLLTASGGNAVSISGVDSAFITAHPLGAEYGLVANVANVDTKLLSILIDNDFIPVISPIGMYEGRAYNINADTVASAIASSLQAEKLMILSDVDGVMDGDKLISSLKLSRIPSLLQKNVITDSMIPKINACVEAMRLGVKTVHIINGTTPHSILTEVFTQRGIGTIIEGW